MRVRDATRADLAAIVRIYNQAVRGSTATFDVEPATVASRSAWFARFDADHPILVAETDRAVVGYAYAASYRPKPAYRHTREVSVYVDETRAGHGVGSALYEALIGRARAVGVHVLVAVIGGENPRSDRLHAKFGFEPVGRLREVGWKFDAWVDTVIWQRLLEPRS